MSERLSDSENVAIGSVAAVIEGVCLQPTLYWKNAAAQGLPFTADPRLLYRGLGASIANEVAQLSAQVLITGMAKRFLATPEEVPTTMRAPAQTGGWASAATGRATAASESRGADGVSAQTPRARNAIERAEDLRRARRQGHPMSANVAHCEGDRVAESASEYMPRMVTTPLASVGAATMGGALTATLATPIELVMVQQQMHGGTIFDAVGRTLKAAAQRRPGGVGGIMAATGLFRGLVPAMSRDAGYVGGMLGITPVVQERLKSRQGRTGKGTDRAISVAASVVGGVTGALVSHPSDVVKTCMQGDLDGTRYGLQARATLARIYSERGLTGLYRGFFWRTTNIICCVFIVNECFTHLAPR
mmetsp:Transcript_488/g.1232  ORF Transcript_488/g.1232 Transcript_488/m.1232 type:complete len:361 (-) Transcript_488:643-1725(-)|eukprot:CAMPEP_0185161970 /NCGR_PEP_ID=MMETSP1139-20130426/5809_1 /TAXON_ID=298111 /ORGANISM="Pavlova sp., Strain CCMP459" /LENGTH=360 /DNA_ID=CAMNT_0027727271 /DNA_START=126 /DNA_END=1208 /DNA_ORIENTATION=+